MYFLRDWSMLEKLELSNYINTQMPVQSLIIFIDFGLLNNIFHNILLVVKLTINRL